MYGGVIYGLRSFDNALATACFDSAGNEFIKSGRYRLTYILPYLPAPLQGPSLFGIQKRLSLNETALIARFHVNGLVVRVSFFVCL